MLIDKIIYSVREYKLQNQEINVFVIVGYDDYYQIIHEISTSMASDTKVGVNCKFSVRGATLLVNKKAKAGEIIIASQP